MLPLDIDPKLAWALQVTATAFRSTSTAQPREHCCACPGLGTKAVDAHPRVTPLASLRLDDVARLTVSIAKVRPFIVTADWRPTLLTDRADLRSLVAPKAKQLELFAA